MELGIEGRVALVGGASQGLGFAVADELAHEGVALVICSRNRERIAAAAERIQGSRGVPVVPVAADLSRGEDVARVLSAARDAFGRVDILVTNTGGPPSGPFESHDDAAWRHAVANNLESVIGLTRGVLPGMKERRWGRILHVTSVAVKQPVEGLILSNSVRAAVTGFARTLANETAPHGITVNCILPGYTRTARLDELAGRISESHGVSREEAFARWERQIPMRRLGDPREFAALVAFLASERAAYITGTSIPVDGGWVQGLL
jgi:3-oxoacyl-[acyl-carrier protein] reductase